MPYCTYVDVKLLVETTLENSEIDNLIGLADADLDDMLGGSPLSTLSKKKCSMMLTAAMIAERQPRSYTVGSVRIDTGGRVREWRRKVNEIVTRATTSRAVVRSSSYSHIDEDARYSA